MKKPVIEFNNFSFQYRAQAKPTLKNINLKINDILIYESNSKMEQDNLIYQVDNINNEIMEMKHKLDIINKFNNISIHQ